MEKIKFLKKYGYYNLEISKILSNPAIISMDSNTLCFNIEMAFSTLEKWGFSKAEFIKITTIFPNILSYDYTHLQNIHDFFTSKNISDQTIHDLISSRPQLLASQEIIEEKYNFLQLNNLTKLIYEDPNILLQSIELTTTKYLVHTTPMETLSIKQEIPKNIKNKEPENCINSSSEKLITIEQVEDIFKSFQFSSENSKQLANNVRIKSFFELYPHKISHRIQENLNHFIQLGISPSDIPKLITALPKLAIQPLEPIDKVWEHMINIGYTKEQIISMSLMQPNTLTISKEKIIERFQFLCKKGFSTQDVIYITAKHPYIYTKDANSIDSKILTLSSKYLSYEQTIKLMKKCPRLFGLSDKIIRDKLDYLISEGYTISNYSTSTISNILYMSFDKLKEKIEFYKLQQINSKTVNTQKDIFSDNIDITYAKYRLIMKNKKKFTQEDCIILSHSHTLSNLCKQNKTTPKEILEKYNYSEYISESRKKSIIKEENER